MSMKISFPGNMKVRAEFGGFTVDTDQPVAAGGDGSAPAPFELFLVSLGTCAGLYAMRFCERRGLPTEGLGVSLETESDESGHRLAAVRIHLDLPEGFPAKYHDAIVRSAKLCAVKRAIDDPPEFDVVARAAAA